MTIDNPALDNNFSFFKKMFKDSLFNLFIGFLQITCTNITQVDVMGVACTIEYGEVIPIENVRPKELNVDRVKQRKNLSPEKRKISDIEEHFRYIEPVIPSKKWRVQNSPSVDHCGSKPPRDNLDTDAFSNGSSTKSLPLSLNGKKNIAPQRSILKQTAPNRFESLQNIVEIVNISDGSKHPIRASAKSLINRSPVDVSLSQQVMPQGM